MAKLWQKTGTKIHPLVTSYIVSKDCVQDKTLLKYDIAASIVHAEMLAHVSLISKKEADALIKTLKEIEVLEKKGRFPIRQEDEDCHTAIENYLVKKLGDVGKKIHMGRSRNDQVLAALRLFSKDMLKNVRKETAELAKTILEFAKKYEFVPMPGYTHTQHAMPSSVGQWAGSFVESLLDDLDVLEAAANLNDQNPLGSAAGFGTSLPIDREYTTQKLGFKKLQSNTLYCQNSRGKIESFAVGALLQAMMTLGKIANDMMWFTSKEFSFFIVDKSLTTGSSIMPQKQNLDIMEVLRANVSVVMSCQMQIQTVGLNLLSGYNKDSKVTKKPLLEAFKIILASLSVAKLLFQNMKPNATNLESAFDAEIFAADRVNELVKTGLPFRDAYRKIGDSLHKVKPDDLRQNLKMKKHIGAPGNLRLAKLSKYLNRML